MCIKIKVLADMLQRSGAQFDDLGMSSNPSTTSPTEDKYQDLHKLILEPGLTVIDTLIHAVRGPEIEVDSLF